MEHKYKKNDIVILRSGYTGHLMKIKVIGPTQLVQREVNGLERIVSSDIGLAGIELDDAGNEKGWRLSGWNWEWVIGKTKLNAPISCPHCASAMSSTMQIPDGVYST